MTVNQEPQEWPLHLNEDGNSECPACFSDDVEDTGHGPNPTWLEEMGLTDVPNYHECNACGNVFLPVDATEHPMRSFDNMDVM